MSSKLIGSYLITKGLSLFEYDVSTNKIKFVAKDELRTLTLDVNTTSPNNKRLNVSQDKYYFEALNKSSAIKRVAKYTAGTIKQLNNLRPSKAKEVPKNVVLSAAGLRINKMMQENKSNEVVMDNEICYGTKEPICGVPIGSRGLIKDKTFITCPKCRDLMYDTI